MADIIHVRGPRGSAEGAEEKAEPLSAARSCGARRRSGGASPLRRRPGRGRGRGRGGGKGAAGARARRLLRGAQGTVRPAPHRASPRLTLPASSLHIPPPRPGLLRPGLPAAVGPQPRGWSRSLQLQWRRAPGCGDVSAENARGTPGRGMRGRRGRARLSGFPLLLPLLFLRLLPSLRPWTSSLARGLTQGAERGRSALTAAPQALRIRPLGQ